jgi:AcrR family transcriptional regulator
MPRSKLENAKARLLGAGLALFARHGTDSVNSNKIARRAGLGVGTFYSHFPDKFALLREIEQRTLTGLRDARLAALREIGSDPIGQVGASVAAGVHFAEQHPEAYRVTFGRERAGAARHGPLVSESSRPTAEALRRLQQGGVIEAGLDVDLAARAYLSMEVGMVLWWLEDPSRASSAAMIETLVRLHPLRSAQLSG